jgi:hypothetical protein
MWLTSGKMQSTLPPSFTSLAQVERAMSDALQNWRERISDRDRAGVEAAAGAPTAASLSPVDRP